MRTARGHATKGVLANHYGLTDDKLDFIPSTLLRACINYDITYRMGRDAEGEDK